MEIIMADATTTTETDAVAETSGDSAETTAAATEATTETAATDGEQALGDAGKKALDAMKAKWKDADARAKTEADARAALQAKLDGKEAEHTAAQERAAVEAAALSKANERILKAEVRAAAAAKLADPQDALRFLDLSEFEVGSDGEVDASQVAKAIDDLIASKPYLAAQGGQRFQGSADGGARNGSAQPTQLTQQDVKRLAAEGKHEEINKAREAGQLNDLLGIKP
jgi:hypothetical protein